MIVPGSNLLSVAMRVIRPQAVKWSRAIDGPVYDDAGRVLPAYDAPEVVYGSVQAVSGVLLQQLALDASKEYIHFYTRSPVRGIERGRTGDKIEYKGHTYAVQTVADWHAQDGWKAALCVKVDP